MVSLVCLGNSLHVFQVNKDFTCFPKYVFLENSDHPQQCEGDEEDDAEGVTAWF